MIRSKASVRRGLVSKIKLHLKRPATFRIAVFVLNLVSLIVRLINFFK